MGEFLLTWNLAAVLWCLWWAVACAFNGLFGWGGVMLSLACIHLELYARIRDKRKS